MIQVGPSQIFRGPRLGTDPIAWKALKDAGVTTVINLERGYFEVLHRQLNEEVRQAERWDMVPIHIQLGDVIPPKTKYLVSALELVLESGKRGGVYIHCLHGVDRTGLLCAMVRVKLQGWTAPAAIGEMLKLGFHEFPYRQLGWIKRLEECLK
jgi:protein-tyrosine phosphatase